MWELDTLLHVSCAAKSCWAQHPKELDPCHTYIPQLWPPSIMPGMMEQISFILTVLQIWIQVTVVSFLATEFLGLWRSNTTPGGWVALQMLMVRQFSVFGLIYDSFPKLLQRWHQAIELTCWLMLYFTLPPKKSPTLVQNSYHYQLCSLVPHIWITMVSMRYP